MLSLFFIFILHEHPSVFCELELEIMFVSLNIFSIFAGHRSISGQVARNAAFFVHKSVLMISSSNFYFFQQCVTNFFFQVSSSRLVFWMIYSITEKIRFILDAKIKESCNILEGTYYNVYVYMMPNWAASRTLFHNERVAASQTCLFK